MKVSEKRGVLLFQTKDTVLCWWTCYQELLSHRQAVARIIYLPESLPLQEITSRSDWWQQHFLPQALVHPY